MKAIVETLNFPNQYKLIHRNFWSFSVTLNIYIDHPIHSESNHRWSDISSIFPQRNLLYENPNNNPFCHVSNVYFHKRSIYIYIYAYIYINYIINYSCQTFNTWVCKRVCSQLCGRIWRDPRTWRQLRIRSSHPRSRWQLDGDRRGDRRSIDPWCGLRHGSRCDRSWGKRSRPWRHSRNCSEQEPKIKRKVSKWPANVRIC